MPYCEKCGTAITNEAKFCSSCGETVVNQPTDAANRGLAATSTSSPPGIKQNVAALLCYAGLPLFVLGLIAPILFLLIKPYSQNRFIRFHAFQAIGVNIVGNTVYFVIDRATLVPTFWGPPQHSQLSWITLVILILVDVFFMAKSYSGSMTKVPGLGDVADQLAGHHNQSV